jgi:hypothetical protein
MAINIDNYFVERRNQFQKSTIQRLTRTNPFRSLVPMSPFPLQDGRTPTVRTLTHELPTAYPSSLTEVAVSTGTGNPECAPSPTTIKRGEVHRTFKLYSTSFRTDTVCVSDLKRAEQAADAAAAFERALREYITVWWSDWYRLQNISMVDNKISTTDADYVTFVTSTAANHTGVSALPDQYLNWTHLDQIYMDLIRRGVAEEYAVGVTSSGMPVIPILLSPGLKQKLFRDDSDKREQVKYFNPQSNLAVLGYNGAINGWLPIVDVFPIRYGKSGGLSAASDLTAANMIYPTVNGSATVGRKNSPNPNYLSVARGGLAECEVVTILPNSVYEAHFEAVDPSSFSGMSFQPQNYIGEFKWINNPTFEGDNDRGNLGYYLADIRVGAKPLNPDLGISIVTKVTNV